MSAPTASQKPMTIGDVLCQVGHRLVGAADAIEPQDAISTLDNVRLCALTNNEQALKVKPPLLLPDSLLPTSFFLHTSTDSDGRAFNKGGLNPYAIPGLKVVGGCMLESDKCCFPVVVLFSQQEKTLIIHSSNASIAKMEAEMNDSAFGPCDWESMVLKEEAGEIKKWRQEAAYASRNVGFNSLPDFMCDGTHMFVTRYGINPFMSLRTVKNEAEFKEVRGAIKKALSVVPVGSLDWSRSSPERGHIVLMSVFGNSPMKAGVEATAPSQSELNAMADELTLRSVLTRIALLIIEEAADDVFDANGEHISELGFQMKSNPRNDPLIRSARADEYTCFAAACATKATDLQASVDSPYTLSSVMDGIRTSYATRRIALCSGEDVKPVVEAVAFDLFCKEDAVSVVANCCSPSCPSLTLISALGVLGKCLVEEQVLVVASREADGRFGQVRAFGSSKTVACVGLDAFQRFVLSPFASILIVDRDRVFKLEVHDPPCVSNVRSMRSQQLKLKSSSKSSPPSFEGLKKIQDKLEASTEHMSKMSKTMEEMAVKLANATETNARLSKANVAHENVVKELMRKVDYLVSTKADGQSSPDAPPQAPAPAPSPAPAPAPTAESTMDKTGLSLKRTLHAIEEYAKRMRS